MRTFPVSDVTECAARLLQAKGLGREDARWMAGMAVTAEAMGRRTHGLAQIFALCQKIPESVNPNVQPEIRTDKGASLCIDITDGIGQLGMKKALELGEARAGQYGIAMIGVGRTSWIGAAGPYLLDLASKGFLGQIHAQTSNCKDCAPFGGIDARFSTNPIALAFPTGGEPVVADFSTATMAMGKVWELTETRKKASYPAFLDKQGNETDDPTVTKDGGTLQFMGGKITGHKGYALSLWCEAMVALTGGDCNNPEAAPHQSFMLTVIDPDGFAGLDYFLTEMKRFIAHVKSSRPLPGLDAVLLPGERAIRALRAAEMHGITLAAEKLDQLNSNARKLGVAGLPPA